ncbi:PP2C family protein-serine/threonine phosphatase [Streptomyces sp. GD-15H]|uniref:PP2C family protein-serine/threonine phosphatase n=1 Tax=Streptomyces sp. GD-15H TaxID=3129112 RepID=UPI00324B1C3E
MYLRSRDRRSLVLCVVTGVPRSLLKPWWRMPVGGALHDALSHACPGIAWTGCAPGRSRRCARLAALEADAFATCCSVELDPGIGRAFAVRAGRSPPLLRHSDGRTESPDPGGGVMPGVEADSLHPVTALTLAPGSVLALYTDGLVEQPGRDIETGIDAVRHTLAHSGADSVEELADRLVRAARRVEDRQDHVAPLLTAFRRVAGS